jgi:hypothetical protein
MGRIHGPQWCPPTVFVVEAWSSIPGYFGKDSVTINLNPDRPKQPFND